jgi:hypothetical protein
MALLAALVALVAAADALVAALVALVPAAFLEERAAVSLAAAAFFEASAAAALASAAAATELTWTENVGNSDPKKVSVSVLNVAAVRSRNGSGVTDIR